MRVTPEELLAAAGGAYSEAPWNRVLSCDRGRPLDTCLLVGVTCGAGAPTQSPEAQRAAVKLRAAITGEDEQPLAEQLLHAACRGDEKCALAYSADNEHTDRLARELAVEMGNTGAYFRAMHVVPALYRGVAVPEDHPLVKELRETQRVMKLVRRGWRGWKDAYAVVGVHYTPKPLESWTLNKAVASDFAHRAIPGKKTVPLVLTKSLISAYEPDYPRENAVQPVLTSLTNNGCLPREAEVLVLWTDPDGSRDPKAAKYEIRVEEVKNEYPSAALIL